MVDRELAVKIGLNEAHLIEQVHYWLERSKNDQDGYRWVYNTLESWQEQFPFWSKDTIKRGMKKLKDLGLIITIDHYKSPGVKSRWYRIDYEKLEEIHPSPDGKTKQSALSGKQNAPTNGADCPLPGGQIAPFHSTETTTKTTQETTHITPTSDFEMISLLSPQQLNETSGTRKVFEYWKTVTHQHGRVSLTVPREKLIVKALKENRIEDLITAIERFAVDEWYRDNTGMELHHVMKDQTTIEAWLTKASKPLPKKKPGSSPLNEKELETVSGSTW